MDNANDDLIQPDGTLQVFTYDEGGRFDGIDFADPDPMEPGKWLMPPRSTATPMTPVPNREGKWWFWTGTEWELRDDPQLLQRRAYRMRRLRNRALAESDWTQLHDAPLGPPERGTWRIYRHMLRTLPEQDGWPFIELPTMPVAGQNPTFL